MNTVSEGLSSPFIQQLDSNQAMPSGQLETQLSGQTQSELRSDTSQPDQNQFWQLINKNLADLSQNDQEDTKQSTDIKGIFDISINADSALNNGEQILPPTFALTQNSELSAQEAESLANNANPDLSAENDVAHIIALQVENKNAQLLNTDQTGKQALEGGIILPLKGQVLPVVERLPRQQLMNQFQDSSPEIIVGSEQKNLNMAAAKESELAALAAGKEFQSEINNAKTAAEQKMMQMQGLENKDGQQKDAFDALTQVGKTASSVTADSLPASNTAIGALSAAGLGSTPLAQSPLTHPSSSTLQLSPQATPTQWGDAVGEKLQMMINQKNHSAEIRIDPPHLGKLDIQINIRDDVASISINTQNSAAQELIEAASHRLKEFLQQAGYSQVNVDVSQHSEKQMAQQKLDKNAESGEGTESTTEAQTSTDEVTYASDSIVDFYA